MPDAATFSDYLSLKMRLYACAEEYVRRWRTYLASTPAQVYDCHLAAVSAKVARGEALSAILRLHQAWVDGSPDGVLADLEKVQLINADLSHADLRSVRAAGVNLAGSDLSGADLAMADLRGANLSSASLAEASLCDADLSGARLYNTSLEGAVLSGVKLAGATYGGFSLDVVRDDIHAILDAVPGMDGRLLDALRHGKVAGAEYIGNQFTLVETAYNLTGGRMPWGSRHYAEAWCRGIRSGRTPADSTVCNLTVEFIRQWQAAKK